MDSEKAPVVVAADRPANLRFLGLTKFAFLASLIALLLSGVILLSSFLAYEVGQNRRLARQGVRATVALCALRTDLKQRIATEEVAVKRAEDYLVAHPDGIPGIPAALIRQGIATQHTTIIGQQSTVHVLGQVISCPVSTR